MASQAFVEVVADTSGVDRQLTQGMTRAIRDVESRLDPIDVNAEIDPGDISDMASELRRGIRDIQSAVGEIDVGVEVDTRALATARARLTQFQEQVAGIDLELHPEISAADLARVRTELNSLEREVSSLDRQDINIDVDVDEPLIRRATDSTEDFESSILSTIGTVARLGATAPVALGAVTSSLGAMTSAATSAVSAFGGLSSILDQTLGLAGVAAVTFGVFKVATIGVGDAFSALTGPADKFNDALKELSPEAQRVFTTLRSGVPAMKRFQQALQDALFKPIQSGTLEKFNKTLSGIQPAANKVATAFGGVIEKIAELAVKQSTIDTLNKLLKEAAPLVTKVGDFLVSKLGAGLDRAAKGTESFSSSFKVLKSVFETVKGVASDVGQIFGAIGDAADDTGGKLGGIFLSGLHDLADALNSKPGQEFLRTLMSLSNTITETVVPAVGNLAAQLAPLVQKIAESLQPAVEAMQPVLTKFGDTVGTIGDALGPVIDLLGQIADQVIPALSPVLDNLNRIWIAAKPAIEEVAGAIGGFLKPILDQLPDILARITEPMTRLAEELFPIIRDTAKEMAPSLKLMGENFAEIYENSKPAIDELGELAFTIGPPLAEIISKVALIAGLLALSMTEVMSRISALIPWLVDLREKLTTGVYDAFQNAQASAATGSAQMLLSVQRFISSSLAALGNWANNLSAKASAAWAGFKRAASIQINAAIADVRALPGRAVAALGVLSYRLYSAGASLISGFIRGIRDQIPSISSVLGSITRNLPDWKGPEDLDKKILTPSGRYVIEGFMEGISKQVPALRAQLGGITLGMPQMAMAGTPATSPAASFASDMGSVSSTTSTRVENYVYIDGQQVRVIADQQIVRNNQDRDRRTAQGLRR